MKSKMCEPETNFPLSPSPSPSPSTPRVQISPLTSVISPRYTSNPNIIKRMQSDKCFKCNQLGHWASFCPLNSPNNKPFSPSPNHHSMCEPETNFPLSPSPSPSTPRVQISSLTPEISPRYTLNPNIIKRMQSDTCFKCNQLGHWASFCPLNSPNNKPFSPSPNHHSMCEPETNFPLSPSPSPSTPRVQISPLTPEISPCYTLNPNIIKRMQSDTCFKCKQLGHWALFCPLNSPNHHSLKEIQCRCGHGSCDIKTVNNIRNRGRMYYVCPIQRGARCKDFVKWCDDHIDDSELQPPLFKYPVCECGAGVCRREKETPETPDDFKYYFVCPVRKGHGSCGYRISEDELLNCTSIVPSRQRSLDEFLEGCQNDETDNDLGKECDLLVQNKRMRIMDDSENSLSIVVSEIPEVEDGGSAIKAACSEHVGFPEFDISDDDLEEFTNSVPWEAIEAEAFVLSSLSTPLRIRNRQSVFQRDLDDASFDSCPMDWLGRLLFVHPAQSLKFPPPQPFFCCVFPSFNPISVPKQASIPNGPLECNNLAINNLSQHTQLSTGCYNEVSRDVVSPNKSPASESKLISKAQRHRKVALVTQQLLLNDLENLNPHEHELMRETVDYKQFSEHIWTYINHALSISEMDKSLENSLTLEEHNKLFEKEKVRLAQIQEDYGKIEALLEESNQRRQSLCEEVSHLEAMLHEKQNQLRSCELEMMKIETDLSDMKRRKLEVDMILRDRAEQVEMARKQIEEKQAKQIAAKTALEKAKLELED